MFTVICLETNETCGEYPDGASAAQAARVLSDSTGKKYQPRRAKASTDWRDRERKRFEDGTYTAVPWHNTYWALRQDATQDHFVHVSTQEPGKLAYTASAEHGEFDRQTRMRPGRYLTAFYSDVLDSDNIKRLANEFAGMYEPSEILFATTADEIEHVYTSGPNSCMSHGASDYDSPCHPVRMYAAGDLAVAYLENDGDISARCIVWREKQIHSRIYGDEFRLGAALERAGYREGNMRGAKLKRKMYNGAYVVPYLDCSHHADDNGDYLIIGGGDISCRNTNGLSDLLSTCDHCGDSMDEDFSHSIDGESWCNHCYDNNTFYCESCEESHSGDDYVNIQTRRHDAVLWCSDCFDRHGFECEGDGRNYPNDQQVALANGTMWSQAYYEEHGFSCDDCSEAHHNYDAREIDGRTCCPDCATERAPDDGIEPATPTPHRAKQGRDESPDQTEMPLTRRVSVDTLLDVGQMVVATVDGVAGAWRIVEVDSAPGVLLHYRVVRPVVDGTSQWISRYEIIYACSESDHTVSVDACDHAVSVDYMSQTREVA